MVKRNGLNGGNVHCGRAFFSLLYLKGDAVTVDVKGLAGKTAWPVDKVEEAKKEHFLAFVCYFGKIDEVEVSPEVWIIPSTKLAPFVYHAPGGRKVVQRSQLLQEATEFRNA